MICTSHEPRTGWHSLQESERSVVYGFAVMGGSMVGLSSAPAPLDRYPGAGVVVLESWRRSRAGPTRPVTTLDRCACGESEPRRNRRAASYGLQTLSGRQRLDDLFRSEIITQGLLPRAQGFQPHRLKASGGQCRVRRTAGALLHLLRGDLLHLRVYSR
jgi:hypothetical protein